MSTSTLLPVSVIHRRRTSGTRKQVLSYLGGACLALGVLFSAPAETHATAPGSYTTCSGYFNDTGGTGGGYGNNESNERVFCPTTSGMAIRAEFTSFSTEHMTDFLFASDGNGNGLAAGYGTISPGIVQAPGAYDGCMSFMFTSDASTTYPGRNAQISCVPAVLECTDAVIDEDFSTLNGSCSFGNCVIYDGPDYTISYERSGAPGRIRYGSSSPVAGRAMLDQSSASSAINYLIFETDLSAATSTSAVQLSFTCGDHGDESHAADRVEVRGSDTDSWVYLDGLDGCASSVGPLNVTEALNNASQTFTSTFQFRFGQEDNGSYPNEGRSFDDIVLTAPIFESEIWYQDTDADGYGVGVGFGSCEDPGAAYRPQGEMTALSGDCADTQAGANPGAAELCGDGIDNNCDGYIDAITLLNETFESVGNTSYTADATVYTSGSYSIEYDEFSGTNGRLRIGTSAYMTYLSSGGLTMDNAAGTTTNTNYAIFTYSLDGRALDTGLRLSFDFTHHNEASHTQDRVRIRGSDTGSRIQVYDRYANRPASGVWKNSGRIDIDSALTANSQVPTSTFQIRFGHRGAAVAPTDGFSMDNLLIEGSPLTTYYQDADGDGFPSGTTQGACGDPGATWYLAGELTSLTTDCNDGNASINPNTSRYEDADGDGYSDGTVQSTCSDPGATWYLTSELTAISGDCDDNNAVMYSGATEVCDGFDNDCDTQIDEGVLNTFYQDSDGDGYGNSSVTTGGVCSAPSGYSLLNTDCNDSDAKLHPATVRYLDGDNDGFSTGSIQTQCTDPGAARYLPSQLISNGISVNNLALNSGLVGYRTFDSDTAIDDSGNGRDGTLINGVVFSGGKLGRAANFLGTTDYISVPDHASLDLTSQITMSMRITAPTLTDRDSPFMKTSNGGRGDGYGIFYEGGELCAYISASRGNVVCTAFSPTTSRKHVTATYNGVGTPLKLFIDGVEVASAVQNTAITTTNTPLYIGQGGGDAGDYDRNGRVDDVRLYNRGLSTGEVEQLYTLTHLALTTDCNTTTATANPVATEICDGIDNDCDTQIDEGVSGGLLYQDSDGDGYGNSAVSITGSCSGVSGYVSNTGDCNDTVASIYLGAPELTGDAIDQSCDGQELCYVDGDNDGYRTTATVISADLDCSDSGEALASDPANDCNDVNAAINPATIRYSDDDGDGYSDGDTITQCADPGATWYLSGGTSLIGVSNLLGYRSYNAGDGTDDSGNGRTASLNRGATSITGQYGGGIGLNGSTDNITVSHSSAFNVTGMTFATRVYLDTNSAGRISLAHKSKASRPAWQLYARSDYGTSNGYPIFEIDLDNDNASDANEQVFGAGILQTNTRYHIVGTYDGATLSIYQDGDLIESKGVVGSIPTTTNPIRIGANQLRGEYLDGRVDETYFYNRALTSGEVATLYANTSILIAAGDCNDVNAAINPDASEICDGVDNDCDGSIDEGVSTTYYADSDGDGFGNAGVSTGSCSGIPSGYTGDATDCDDSNVAVHPGATEVTCDGLNNDCNAGTPDNADGDGDTYGICDNDCNDANPSVNPGASEVTCDSIDNDCNSATLDNADADGDGYGICDGDCNDANDLVHPATVWYSDVDGDGFSTGDTQTQCADPGSLRYLPNELLGSAATTYSLTINTDLKGYRSFDSNDGDDDSGNGNGMTATGGTTFSGGTLGRAVELNGTTSYLRRDFDGDAALDANNGQDDDSDFDQLTGFTVSARIKADKITGEQVIFSKRDRNSTPNRGFKLYTNTTHITFDTRTTAYVSTADMSALAVNTWIHVLATYDGAMTRLYINGVLRDSDVQTGSISNNAMPFMIGAELSTVTPTSFFDGIIDDARFYTRALTSGEVAQLYILTDKAQTTDCNPTNTAINPLGTEICDGIDNDCDGSIDEGVSTTYYEDSDRDGFGNASVSTGTCSLPTGYVTGTGDCNDIDARLHPLTVWYTDSDADGFGTGSTQTTCTDPGATRYLPGEMSSASNSGAGLLNGRIGHRTFDYRDGRDSSPSLNTGTVPASLTFTGGTIGDAALFTSSGDAITLNTYDVVLSGSSNYTYSARVKRSSSAPADRNTIFGSRTNGRDDLLLHGANSFSVTYQCYDMNTASSCAFMSTLAVPADTRTFVAVVHSGTTVTLYKNDESQSTVNTSLPRRRVRYIGRSSGGRYFSGSIDDARVYDRALSPDEMKALYIAGSQYATGDCVDANSSLNPLTKRYKDTDDDGYSDGTMLQQCGQPAGYKLAVNVLSVAGDCNDSNDLLHPGTVRYEDTDGDGFAVGTTQTTCTDPGATWYLPSELIGSAVTNNSLTINDGLVGYRSFDSNDGDDDSGNSRHGVTSGGIFFTGGKIGNSMQLDGVNDYMTVADNNAFDFGVGDFTVGGRFRKNAPMSNRKGAVVSKRHTGGQPLANEWFLGVGAGSASNDEKPSFYIQIGSTSYGVVSPDDALQNIRYHVLGVRRGSYIYLYVNGVEKASTFVGSSAINNPGRDIEFGSILDGNYVLNGNMDDVRIYNRALTTGEIAQLYTLTDKAQTTDCNPTNTAINPLGTEICDGIDNDCDGSIDENTTTTYYQDSDSDGFGNPSVTTGSCAVPTGYTGDNTDCNDADATLNPLTLWYVDADGDDYSDGSVMQQCDDPGATRYLASDLISTTADCNDSDATVHAGAPEIVANEVDNDCNSQELCYADVDGDTFGSTGTVISANLSCSDSGEASNATDCVDNDSLQKPGQTRYKDVDGDGVSDGTTVIQCLRPANHFVSSELDATSGDCDDADANNYPGNAEVCDDQDNDCDSLVDDADPGYVGGGTYYEDDDGDGYGNPAVSQNACGAPTGYVADNTDCDDADANEFPGQTWYKDADADLYGDAGTGSLTQCLRPTDYFIVSELTATATDCADTNAAVNPGATEIVADGIDNNCNGEELCYRDNDGDLYGTSTTIVSTDLDCTDVLESEYDTDCDDTDVLEYPGQTRYKDADGDGYGDAGTGALVQCLRATDYFISSELTATDTDCADTDAAINPAATEVCDGVDNDCDAVIDDSVQTIFYRDADNDSYGNSAVTTGACSLPSGYVSGTGDCDDTNGRLNPTTIRYYDGDGDNFATGGSTQTQCTDPGASWYLPGELVNTYTSGANLRSGLVGYRTFDGYNAIGENGVGGTGALCNSPAGAGTITPASCDNTGPVFTGGKIDKGLYLNGSGQGVLTPNYNSQNHSYSKFAWIKIAGYPSIQKYILGANSGVGGLMLEANGSFSSDVISSSASAVPLNQWAHVGVTARFVNTGAIYMKLYVNGTIVKESTVSAATFYVRRGGIGMANYGGNNYSYSRFQGYIDDVRIYNRSLSADEVRLLYASTNNFALDCQDSNAAVHPGAAEVCDGSDNNCSSSIDEGVINTYRKDYDADTRSDGTSSATCSAASGYALPSSPLLPGYAQSLSTGLVAYYTFENGNANNVMGAVSTGTLINGATLGAGKNGSGIVLDGVNDMVGISVSHPEAFTKAAWIRPTNMAHCAANRCTVFGPYLEIIGSNILTFYSYELSPVGRTSTPSNTIVENERQHVAVTFDGYAIRLFHNGVQKAEKYVTQTAPIVATNRIGSYDGTTRPFSGAIDEAMIYDRALTPGQIAALYTGSVLYTSGDCNDLDATINGATTRYKDSDDDRYSDGTSLTQCAQPTGYKLASALLALSGDCNDANDLQTPYTVWYEDTDGDGFTPGTAVEQCAYPGATWYLPSELIGSAVTNSSLTIDTGLVGYRSFDSNDGDDDSGNGNHGSILGNTIFAAGKIGNAAIFDGNNDSVELPDMGTAENYPFSMAVWFKTSSSDNTMSIFGQSNSANSTQRALLKFSGGGQGILNYNIGNASAENEILIGTAGQYKDDQWHHVVAVSATSNLHYVYVDGQLAATGTVTVPSPSLNTNFVGTRSGQSGYDFSGSVDDARLYNRALSSGEIYQLYTLTDKAQSVDCNTGSGTVHPLATEVCDGLDNDCDGQVDENLTTTYYEDSDGDGFGNPGVAQQLCGTLSGYVTDNTDCDDTDADINPNSVRYLDADGDGYSEGTTQAQCADPGVDRYLGNLSEDPLSCSTGSGQLFGDTMLGCSGSVTYANRATLCPVGTTVCTAEEYVARRNGATPLYNYRTDDNLRYNGTSSACYASTTAGNLCGTTPMRVCTPTGSDGVSSSCNRYNCGHDASAPNEYFGGCSGNTYAGALCCGDVGGIDEFPTGDCDDTDAAINPDTIRYKDSDGDGYSDGTTQIGCTDPGAAYYLANELSALTGDCNDGDSAVNPGMTELVGDGVDSDCDGEEICRRDDDGDSFGTNTTIGSTDVDCNDAFEAYTNTDCNDANDLVHPNTVRYEDTDGDGFAVGTIQTTCSDPGATWYLPSELIGSAVTNNSLTFNNGLIGYRSFDSNDLDDDSGNGYEGSGANISYGTGQLGRGARFNGSNSSVTMITGNTAYSGNAVTVSTRLKFDSLNGTVSCGAGANGLQYIIFKRNTLLGRFEGFALLKDYAHKLSFAVGSSTQYQTSVGAIGTAVSTNTRYHVVGVFERPYLRLYINGALVEEKYHDYPLNYGPYPVHLGRTGECGGAGKGTWDAYFSGTQDDVRIYNRALSSGEISQLYTVTHKAQTTDCNPTNTAINPLGTELCDGVDNDCDGLIDEAVTVTFYQDSDGDSFGNSAVTTGACSAPSGYTGDNTDCNDISAVSYPGASEICDGLDNDCDTQIDEGVITSFFLDSDGDGYGNPLIATGACTLPGGYATGDTDCDDANLLLNPLTSRYSDDDTDGFSDNTVQTQCTDPGASWYILPQLVNTASSSNALLTSGLVGRYFSSGANAQDGGPNGNHGTNSGSIYKTGPLGFAASFDGVSSLVKVPSTELILTGQITIGLFIKTSYTGQSQGVISKYSNHSYRNYRIYLDAAGKPHFQNGNNLLGRNAIVSGDTSIADGQWHHVMVTYDKQFIRLFVDGIVVDSKAETRDTGLWNSPLAIGTNSYDPNTVYLYGTQRGLSGSLSDIRIYNYGFSTGRATQFYNALTSFGSGDCVDTNGVVHPLTNRYKDADADGYSDGIVQVQCADPGADRYLSSALTATTGDCEDTNALMNPAESEICDQLDNDCDGTVDEGVTTTLYIDNDDDGYGNSEASTGTCAAILSGYSAFSGDCNDAAPTAYPNAPRICGDEIDNNCDDLVDIKINGQACTMCDHYQLTTSNDACYALRNVFTGTNGSGRTNTSGWIQTPNVGSRYGVTVTGGIVTALELTNNGLSGAVPPALGTLSGLITLDLSDNALTALPDTISSLSALQALSVQSNALTVLPSQVGALSDLIILRIGNNTLGGTIPSLSGLTELHELGIQNLALTQLPDGITSMTDLEHLFASGQSISVLPSALGLLSALQILDVSHNILTGLPAQIADLTALETLLLNHNQLSGGIPAMFGVLTNLSTLAIQNNYYDRDANHDAVIPASLTSRFATVTSKTIADQNDTRVPVLSTPQQLYVTPIASFSYTVNITENSYAIAGSKSAVASGGQGMPVSVTGSAACAGLQVSAMGINTGTATLTITPTTGGVFSNCVLRVTDHAGNVSSGVAMPTFVVSNDPAAICLHPDTTIPTSECQALYQLYTHTSGTGRTTKTNRMAHPDVESRFGVTTAEYSGQMHVSAIALPNNNLKSTIPSEISGLPYLQSLNVAGNQLHTIENGISSLSQVSTLNASSNQLVTLPSSFSGLTSLTTMNVANNALTSVPAAIGQLSALDTLDISNNSLTTLPDEITQLRNLDILNVSYNSITSLPISLSGLSDLDILYINNNSLTTLPSSLGDLTNLTALDIGNNQLTSLPDIRSTLSTLLDLRANNNQLTTVPDSLGTLSALQRLVLDYNQITSLPQTIGGLTALQSLEVRNNLLTSLPDSITQLTGLVTLQLGDNDIVALGTGITAFSNLEYLYLHNNALTVMPEEIGALTQLRFLYLYNNLMAGTIPDSFTALTNLNRFYIQENYLDRDNNHNAIIPESVNDRFTRGGMVSHIYGQKDGSAPVISMTGTVPLIVAFFFNQQLTITENSYAINGSGAGMAVAFTGGGICGNLNSSPVIINSGTVTISIQSTYEGYFENCGLYVRDHAGNVSNVVIIPSFVLSLDVSALCDHPEMIIPADECRALASIYTSTSGSNRTNDTNRFRTLNPEERFGVRLGTYGTGLHVDGLFLHRSSGSDAYGSSITWNGNNIHGTLPNVFGQLPYLKDLNLTNNALGGELPASLGTLVNLDQLRLADNDFAGSIPDVSGMVKLRVFRVAGNRLTGILPSTFASLPLLEALDVGNNQLQGTIDARIGNLTGVWYLRVSSNEFTGTIPTELAELTGLQYLHLNDNNFVGTVPSSFTALTQLREFFIQGNNLNRDNRHFALIPSGLTTRYTDITSINNGQTNSQNQGDITPPVISGTGSVPFSVATGFTYDITISENSYPVTIVGQGMRVAFTGGTNCSALQSTTVTTNSGTAQITITPTADGMYDGCELYLIDHGGNTSNTVELPFFVYGMGEASICFDDSMTIPWEECMVLATLYSATNGSGRTNTNNRLEVGDVDTRFGINVTEPQADGNRHVSEILLHRSDATSTSDGLYEGNNLIGTIPSEIAQLKYLTTLRLGSNVITGTIPTELVTITGLQYLDLSYTQLTGSLPPDIGEMIGLQKLSLAHTSLGGTLPISMLRLTNMKEIDFSYNALTGSLPTNMTRSGLESINLSHNQLGGTLPSTLFTNTSLKEILLGGNRFGGTLPPVGTLENLEILELYENQLIGSVPSTLSMLQSLRTIDIHGNKLKGNVLSHIQSLTGLRTVDVSDNSFTGSIVAGLTALTNMETFLIQQNAFVRDVSHNAVLGSGVATWFNALVTKNRTNQRDTTPPVLKTTDTLLSPVTLPFERTFTVNEESYAVSSTGAGMKIGFTGTAVCSNLISTTTETTTASGTVTITVVPTVDGTYACSVTVTDHGGNVGKVAIPNFRYDTSCGDGLIDTNGKDNIAGNTDDEVCDEGSYCDDGRDCTDDATICPAECKPRLVDNCNPSCDASRCGDKYLDDNGLDNQAGTFDDETCDTGSYCNDGTECTYDSSICPGGAFECQPRYVNGCSPYCTAGECGDGYLDADGLDNIADTADDEECDDGNGYNGDGCSTACTVEYCGDGYIDTNGKDNIPNTNDDEECDEGPNNGVLGGLCSSTCDLPDDQCVFCFETCEGGTGHHSMFLLIDTSGSMGGSKMANAIQGAQEFVDLIAASAAINSGFSTKVGLIEFNSDATVVVNPTFDYDQVKSAISGLVAGGGTNFGDPLWDAVTYFETNDTTTSQHIVLLSDGEPTNSTDPLMTPEERAVYASQQAKARGINIYTISLEQTLAGTEFMTQISSSTLFNVAQGKSATQVTTSSSLTAAGGVDASTDSSTRAQTTSVSEAWRQVDLGASYAIKKLNLRNRTGTTTNVNKTSNYYIFVSNTPFSSTSISGTLGAPGVTALYTAGVAGRPSSYDVELTGRYVRVQLIGTNNLSVAEMQVFGCPVGQPCTDAYNFEDYSSSILDTIYGHIFGSIHCGCSADQLCGICGDGLAETDVGEECDEGSKCDNGTNCTGDPSICATNGRGECRPRASATCSTTCVAPFCGDGVVMSGEVCDDGNTRNGDGCSATCESESCGDGYADIDGPDNIWGNSDDEYCDDGNTANGDGCDSTCKQEFCGDGFMDEDGPDNIPDNEDDEQCDTGRYCNDGTECTDNPLLCPSECKTRFVSQCAPDCTYGVCGDAYVDADGADNTASTSDDEQCDLGRYCSDGVECTHDETLCPGECVPRHQETCTAVCELPICGDTVVTSTSTVQTIRDCSGFANRCGDGIVDPDGTDNVLGTVDDEECDDGNTENGDGCSLLCTYEYETPTTNTCQNGVMDGNETGVDCGGSCKACSSCIDGVQNGSETGVDCGGSCPACASCSDGIQNGTEAGVDCGGSCVNAC